jgi:hypothetical protein
MQVVKAGRTTEVTFGTITTVNLSAIVAYPCAGGSEIFFFRNQVEIGPNNFSNSGDSGSALLSVATHEPVGLLFAGGPNSTLANDIKNVYKALDVFVDSASGTLMSMQEVQQMLTEHDTDPEQVRLESIQKRNQHAVLRLPQVQGIGISKDAGAWFFKVFLRESSPEALRDAALYRRYPSTRCRKRRVPSLLSCSSETKIVP